MKYYLINYANEPYKRTQHLNSWTGRWIARFDEVIEYGPDDVDPEYRKRFENIFSYQRGDGLWLWKPYLMKKTLERVKEGDYVYYCDAGSFFIRNKRSFMDDVTRDDIYVTETPFIEKQWTKPSMFRALNADTDEIKESNQIQSGFVCVRNCARTREFIDQWLALGEREEIVAPLKDDEDHGECISHREDQSTLSVLCKLEGIKPHKDPTLYSRIPEKYYIKGRLFRVKSYDDHYKAYICLHRTKNGLTKYAFWQWLYTWLPIKMVYWMVKPNYPDFPYKY